MNNDTPDLSPLYKLTPEELKALLIAKISAWKTAVLEASHVFAVMEDLKLDVSFVSSHTASLLRRVASGEIVPDIVTKTTGKVRTLAANLPTQTQKALITEGARIPVLNTDTNAVEYKSLEQLTEKEAEATLSRNGVRSPEAQKVWADSQPERRRYSVDRRHGLVRFQSCTLTIAEVKAIIAEAEGGNSSKPKKAA